MPKRYTVEMRIFDEENAELASNSHEEEYDDDKQAKEKFEDKARAARKAGKRSS